MAARKKAKKSKKAPAKNAKKRVVKAARKAAPKRKAKAAAKKAPKKAVAKKAPARKAAAPKKTAAATKTAVKKAPAKRGANKEYGEGNYKASKRFRESEEAFVKAHKSEIPALGKAAEAALEGPEGKDLIAAEEEARGHAAGEDR